MARTITARSGVRRPQPAPSCPLVRGLFAELHPADLPAHGLRELRHELDLARVLVRGGDALAVFLELTDQVRAGLVARRQDHVRSEERRVGKECRSRWSPYH